jgi:hypothetical protein
MHTWATRLWGKGTLCALTLTVILSCTACWPFDDNDVQRAENIVQNGIDELANAPAQIGVVVSNLISELKAYTDTTIKEATASLETIENNAVVAIQTEAQCGADSIGIRGRDSLNYVLQHILERKPAPLPTPWVCQTIPDDIQVAQHASNGPYTLANEPDYKIYGFNFNSSTLPEIDYYRASGQMLTSNVVAARFHTAYQLDVDLQTVNFTDAKPGDYLQLKWPVTATGDNIISIILQPAPNLTKVGEVDQIIGDINGDDVAKGTCNTPWLFGDLYINNVNIYHLADGAKRYDGPSVTGPFSFNNEKAYNDPTPINQYKGATPLQPWDVVLLNNQNTLRITGEIDDHKVLGKYPVNRYDMTYTYPNIPYGPHRITGTSAGCRIDLTFQLVHVADLYSNS